MRRTGVGNIVDNGGFSSICSQKWDVTSPDSDCNSSVWLQTAVLVSVRSQFIQIPQSKPFEQGETGNQGKWLWGFALYVYPTSTLAVFSLSTPVLRAHCCIQSWVRAYRCTCDYCRYNIKAQLCCHCQMPSTSHSKAFKGTRFCLFNILKEGVSSGNYFFCMLGDIFRISLKK